MFGWWLVDPVPDLKRRAAARISERVRDLTALEAGMSMQIDPRRVSDIRAGRLNRFSLEMLVRFLTRLHLRVEIHVNG